MAITVRATSRLDLVEIEKEITNGVVAWHHKQVQSSLLKRPEKVIPVYLMSIRDYT